MFPPMSGRGGCAGARMRGSLAAVDAGKCHKKISLGKMTLLAAVVMAMAYVEKCSGTALPLTLKRFTKDPALMTLLGSVNILLGFTIGPVVAIMSDYGPNGQARRKPFIVAGLILLGLCLFALPLMQSFAMLVVVLIIYQFAMDFGYTGPFRPLYFDNVRSASRGRGMIINRYARIGGNFFFMQFMLGLFGVSLLTLPDGKVIYDGEKLIYHTGAVLSLLSAALVWFGLKEGAKSPEKADRDQRRDFRDVIKILIKRCGSVFVPSGRILFVVAICSVLMTAKMGMLRPLLITQQFGYSPKQLGQLHVITMLISVSVFLPLLAVVIDRWKRWYLVLTGMAGSFVSTLGFWLWVKFVSTDGIPEIHTIIAFKICDALFDQMAMLALWPLVFDCIDDKLKGSFNAGLILVMGFVHFLVNNGLGLFVRCFPVDTGCDYDYMAGYLYMSVLGLIALIVSLAVYLRSAR